MTGEERSQTLPDLHPDAKTFHGFRVVGEVGHSYSAQWEGRAWAASLLRQAAAVGFVTREDATYAVLDVIGENDDIVQDFGIPTAAAWRWWYRKLGLRRDHFEKPAGTPDAASDRAR